MTLKQNNKKRVKSCYKQYLEENKENIISYIYEKINVMNNPNMIPYDQTNLKVDI